jgi:hypothetical protein
MRDLNEDNHLEWFFTNPLDFCEYSGVYNWHSSDTEEWFEVNYAKYPKRFEFYKKYPITYHCNSGGFRSKEEYYPQNEREVDIILGCSHTFGVGHHVKNTWGHILSERIGREVINLGVPGHGPETSYIVLNKYMPWYKVRNVFHFQPMYPRYHVLMKDYINGMETYKHCSTNINVKGDPTLKYKYSDDYKSTMFDGSMIKYEHYKMVDAIRSTCQRFGVIYHGIYDDPYTPATSEYPFKLDHLDRLADHDIPARDLYHYPTSTQKMIANTFYKMYIGRYSNDFNREESSNKYVIKFNEEDYDGEFHSNKNKNERLK